MFLSFQSSARYEDSRGKRKVLRAMETPHVATAGVSKRLRTLQGGFRVPKQGGSLGLRASDRVVARMGEQTGLENKPVLPKNDEMGEEGSQDTPLSTSPRCSFTCCGSQTGVRYIRF